MKRFILMILMAATVLGAGENIVLVVQKETVTEIAEFNSATNVTDRYAFNTLPALPSIAYRSALAGYATSAPAITVSNDIVRDVAGFYSRLGIDPGRIDVRMPP